MIGEKQYGRMTPEAGAGLMATLQADATGV